MSLMKKKIIFTVTNDLVYDRRMMRIGESLVTEGYEILLVGRCLNDSFKKRNGFLCWIAEAFLGKIM